MNRQDAMIVIHTPVFTGLLVTSIFNFTTGHPVLDTWLKAERQLRPTNGAHGVTGPTDISGAAAETATTQWRNKTQGASTPAPELSDKVRRSAEMPPRGKYWEGHNGLHKRS